MRWLEQPSNQAIVILLKTIFYASLGLLVISFSWNAGWNVVGDPYALGPFLPWLELVFPLSGLALWGLFFTQWALGELRPIHISRWFYLLLFVSVLMVNVIFSTQAQSSLGYLSLWMTASLALSLQLEREFKLPWVWYAYAAGIVLSLVAWWLFPPFVNVDLLVMSAFLAALHAWQQAIKLWLKILIIGLTLGGGVYLSASLGLAWLMALAWLFLMWKDYRLYRRKWFWLWGMVFGGIVLFIALNLVPNLKSTIGYDLTKPYLEGFFVWWHGVGIGQFEWAQFQAQTSFQTPKNIITQAPLLMRWWYETGVLMFVLIPCLWLLTLGHGQNFKYRTLLFWAIVLLTPSLWLSPGGIVLGAFWFFNRQSWKAANQLPAAGSPINPRRKARRRGLKLHWPEKSQGGRVNAQPEVKKTQ